MWFGPTARLRSLGLPTARPSKLSRSGAGGLVPGVVWSMGADWPPLPVVPAPPAPDGPPPTPAAAPALPMLPPAPGTAPPAPPAPPPEVPPSPDAASVAGRLEDFDAHARHASND